MIDNKKKPIIIAGPCSAESRDQVLSTAKALQQGGKIIVFRSGVWKPRSRPYSFEGMGKIALGWLAEVKEKYGMPLAVEVATPAHVEAALSMGVDYLWIGARTTANPFSVQDLSEVLRGCDCTIMIKNPVNPDIELWIGSIERFLKYNEQVMAIHRGFYPYEQTAYRNIPKWEIPIELKTRMPQIPIICDPSHIAGDRLLVEEVAQYALDLNFDGLMVESHINPKKALSDASQQLTPVAFFDMLERLQFRIEDSGSHVKNDLDAYRSQIDSIDAQIIELLALRTDVIRRIGQYKITHNVAAFQLKQWKNVIEKRLKLGKVVGLSSAFVKQMFQSVHKESIRIQSELMKSNKENSNDL